MKDDAQVRKAGGVVRARLTALWRVAVHPVTFVVLTILWCVDLAGGSIAAYFNDPQFWQKMDAYPFNLWLKQVAPRTFPASLWVYILVVLSYLMVLSLLLCTVNWFLRRRRRLRGYAEVLVHLGFLLVFGGFVLGSAAGSRTQVVLEVGRAAPVPGTELSLELNSLDLVQSPQGRPLDTISELVLYRGGSHLASGRVRTNHPLIHASTVVYPPDDYQFGVTGAVVGTSTSGAVTLTGAQDAVLRDGRSLSLGGVLSSGQRRGNLVGPGVLVVMRDAAGRVTGSAYLSEAPGMPAGAVVDGVRLTLGQLVQSAKGLYRVHHDPGVWLVIVGAVVLALGTLWALVVYFGVLRGE
ncbi:MAG: cytochrome c biogenesis protein ResB [bacterium]|nr:MAG: cytochrome c biogenesis protein ResB [bacterium]